MEVCAPPGGGGDVPGQRGPGDAASQSTVPGHRDRNLVYSTVGTPDYIAPEVRSFRGHMVLSPPSYSFLDL